MRKWYHVLFIAVCATVLLFLLNAPKATTPRLPRDEAHRDRKDYPRCPTCHGSDSQVSMPADHLSQEGELRTDHAKCYFCHKPQEG